MRTKNPCRHHRAADEIVIVTVGAVDGEAGLALAAGVVQTRKRGQLRERLARRRRIMRSWEGYGQGGKGRGWPSGVGNLILCMIG